MRQELYESVACVCVVCVCALCVFVCVHVCVSLSVCRLLEGRGEACW